MARRRVPPPTRQRAGGWRGVQTSILVIASIVENLGYGDETSGVEGLVSLSSSVNAESDLIKYVATTLLAFVRQHLRVLLTVLWGRKGAPPSIRRRCEL
jgi:hypothetical protein